MALDTGSSRPHAPDRPGAAWLPWIVALVPAGAWFAHLNVSYLLVPVSCRVGHPWWLVAATVVAVAVAGGATAAAVGVVRGRHRSGTEHVAGLVGVLLGGLFLLAIAALGVSNVVVDPCR